MKQSPRSKRLCGSARVGSQTHVYRCDAAGLPLTLWLVVKHAAEGRLTAWAASRIEGQLLVGAMTGGAE